MRMKKLLSGVIALLFGVVAAQAQIVLPGGGAGGGPSSITLPQTIGGTVIQGGTLWFPSTTQMASTALLAANALVVGGGTGAAPHTVTTGLNVLTTLAVAVNAAGGIIAPTPSAAGDIAFWNGTAWVILPGNGTGTRILQETASGVPSWITSAAAGVSDFSTLCPASGPSTGSVTLTNGLTFTAKTVTYTFTTADCGSWYDWTTTGSTPVPAILPTSPGAGFYISTIENSRASTANLLLCDGTVSSGVCTPTGTIDGANSMSLTPGSSVAVIFDGTNYQVTNGVGLDILLFTTPGTASYVPNPSLSYGDLYCLGGGGGGSSGGISASGTIATAGGGGGSGTAKFRRLTSAEIGVSPITITVGAGGAGGAAVSAAGAGNPGVPASTNTTIGSLLGCSGGGGSGPGSGSGILAGAGAGGGLLGTGNTGVAGSVGSSSSGGGNGVSGGTGNFPPVTGMGAGGNSSQAGGTVGLGGQSTANSASGGSGGGVTAATAASAGAVGGSVLGGPSVINGGSGGATNGGTGGNGATGLLSDGLMAVNGLGIIGGSAGGAGGSSVLTNGGSAGTSGFGAGGSGGGAACVGGTCPATGSSGAGGAGGGGAIEIWEHNR